MRRVIDADELKQELDDWAATLPDRKAFGRSETLYVIDRLAENAPRYVESVQAYWILDRPYHYYCSSCESMQGNSALTMHYCPHCAATMSPKYDVVGRDGTLKEYVRKDKPWEE